MAAAAAAGVPEGAASSPGWLPLAALCRACVRLCRARRAQVSALFGRGARAIPPAPPGPFPCVVTTWGVAPAAHARNAAPRRRNRPATKAYRWR